MLLELAVTESAVAKIATAERPESDPYLTVTQVAARLQVGARAIRQQIRLGKLSAKRIGKSWRVGEAELERFARASSAVSVAFTDATRAAAASAGSAR
jgi:excisionase family DNA binding protein